MKFMKIFKSLNAIAVLFILFTVNSTCEPEEEIYGVGDVVQVGSDITMVLNSAVFQDYKLEASFTIENTGTEESGYNLWLSLQARDLEGTPISQLIPCGSDMDGMIQPGEQATGTICWNRGDLTTVRIYYLVLGVETGTVWEVIE